MSAITWLAAADARGHLMRAHLMRELLAREGIRVDVLTTSEAGRDFLAGMGTPARLISVHYRMEFDGAHNLSPARSRRTVTRYLLTPNRFLRDLRALDHIAADATLIVNDFHPLLLVGAALAPSRRAPVVHLYGAHLWEALEAHFRDSGPRVLDRLHTRVMRALRDRGFARVEHVIEPGLRPGPRPTLASSAPGGREARQRAYHLPPMIARPGRTRDEVRAELGVARDRPLAAVYLNPHFATPGVAQAVESALAALGLHPHLVGEGYAGRPGWIARDPRLADVVAAADLFVSGAGMGALGQSAAFGTPLLALLGDQPEQRRNAELESLRRPHGFASVPATRDAHVLAERLTIAGGRLLARAAERPVDAAGAVDAIHRAWVTAFRDLVAEAGRALDRSANAGRGGYDARAA